MTKRKADMSEEEHERVKDRNKMLQRVRKATLTDEGKEQLKLRNREAQRRRREKMRAALGPEGEIQQEDPVDATNQDPSGAITGQGPSTSRESEPLEIPPPQQHPLNLLEGVLGVQLASGSKTVKWSNGQISALPTIQVTTEEGWTNVLEKDESYVRDIATIPESTPDSKHICYLDKNGDYPGLVNAAREALAQNKMVVIRQLLDVHGFELTEKGLYEEFGCFPDRKIYVHDMRLRAEDYGEPGKHTTLAEFLRGITDPDTVQVALDFPLSERSIPRPFELLDDGLCVGWNQTHLVVPLDGQTLPCDAWTMRSWGLAHHAGIVTYPHHDVEGTATCIIPYSGVKNWVGVFIKDSCVKRRDLPKYLKEVTSPEEMLSSFVDKVDCELVYVHPGDFLIMPPGQLHCVYTPVSSFCWGGSFYSLDTMHLTELSRFVDNKSGKYVTNQAHKGTLEALCRLVLALPIISRARKLYKRSLVALCGMVVYHKQYTAEGEVSQTSHCLTKATKVAKVVLGYFSLATPAKYKAFISDKDTDPFFKGEEVNVYDLLADFRA